MYMYRDTSRKNTMETTFQQLLKVEGWTSVMVWGAFYGLTPKI